MSNNTKDTDIAWCSSNLGGKSSKEEEVVEEHYLFLFREYLL
jgi:hypothetical protein